LYWVKTAFTHEGRPGKEFAGADIEAKFL